MPIEPLEALTAAEEASSTRIGVPALVQTDGGESVRVRVQLQRVATASEVSAARTSGHAPTSRYPHSAEPDVHSFVSLWRRQPRPAKRPVKSPV